MDISTSLAPNRNWKITDAQAVAANTTAAQTFLASSIFAAGLGINLPTTSSTSSASSTTNSNTGPTAQTSTSQQQASGTVPTVPTIPSAPTLPTAPSLGAGAPSLSAVDAAELLVTSTALFQQAAIIDNQISKQFLPLGYAAHLVTFQVNVQPLRPDWSYDAFVDITLVPSPFDSAVSESQAPHESSAGLPPIIVKPLIITDALETASVQRSIQEIQQALLQIAGTVGRTGGAAGLNAGKASQISLAGYDKNSLVTAGRVSDATIRIRLGAGFSGASFPTLIPRTYNVSLFLLARVSDAPKNHRVTQLAAITHTFFLPTKGASQNDMAAHHIDPHTGYVKEASSRSRPALAKVVADKLTQYGYGSIAYGCTERDFDVNTPGKPFDPTNPQSLDAYLDLLRAWDRGDFASINACLHLPKRIETTDEEKLYRFFGELSEIQVTSHYARLAIPLKDVTPQLPDAQQLALVTDDTPGVGQQTVTLQGGRNLLLDHVRTAAVVGFPDGRQEWLLPSSVTFKADSIPPQLSIVFPNPATLSPLPAPKGAASSAPSTSAPQLQSLQIVLDDPAAQDTAEPVINYYMKFAKVAPPAGAKDSSGAAAKATPIPTQAQTCAAGQKAITTAVTIVRANATYAGTLGIAVGDLNKIVTTCAQTFGSTSAPTLVQPFTLTVTGADGLPDGKCLLAASDGSVQLNSGGSCMGSLLLSNLSSEAPVTLAVTDKNKTTVGATLSLRVLDAVQKH